MENIIKQRIKDKFDERKNTTFINGTGGYGDNYKKRIIDVFKLDEEYTKMVMSLSYGTVMEITKDLKS